MSTTKTAVRWTMTPAADLAAVAGDLPEADADLTADVAAHGIADPLYVAATSAGPALIDGRRRLAAAVAAGIEHVPTVDRPVIRLDQLTAHPGNVRTDLRITREFAASIAAEGIKIALLLTRAPEGGIRVVDGHRRLAAALQAGETHAPYQWTEDGEADQYVAMVTTARHREGLTEREEAAALFQAAQLGAKVTRLAKAAGRTVAQTKTVIKAGGSEAVARAAKAAPTVSLSLADMEALTRLDGDPQALAEVEAALAEGRTGPSWVISRAVTAAERRKQAEQHRAELEAAGQRVRLAAELSDKAHRLRALGTSPEQHQDCQGHVWVREDDDPRYTPYCANAVLYGHLTPDQATAKPTKGGNGDVRKVKRGNLDWDASTPLRRAWLAELIGRRKQPAATLAALQRITTRHIVAGSHILHRPTDHDLWPEVFGKATDRIKLAQETDKATGPRMIALTFGALAVGYEARMRREAWRTDAQRSPEIRRDAAAWLRILVSLGYTPTPIERAVMDDHPYDPEAPAPQADAPALDQADEDTEPAED